VTIYIDETQYDIGLKNLYGWFHIITDGELEELHEFAIRLGLKRNWFQNKPKRPHYDAYKTKRKIAIDLGAIEITTIEQIKILRNKYGDRI